MTLSAALLSLLLPFDYPAAQYVSRFAPYELERDLGDTRPCLREAWIGEVSGTLHIPGHIITHFKPPSSWFTIIKPAFDHLTR
jgi:hypothetical protein